MGTRSNVIVITPENKAHQIYHHYDGYPSGVGEELRTIINYIIENTPESNSNSIHENFMYSVFKNDQYEDEYESDLDTHNRLHGDIEYLYIIKNMKLFYVNEFRLCDKFNSYRDLVNYVCTSGVEVDLKHKIIAM